MQNSPSDIVTDVDNLAVSVYEGKCPLVADPGNDQQ